MRCEASRHFRNKKREYLKDKINELATKNKVKNIRDLYRGINKFKRGYQPRSNLVKDENGDVLADFHNSSNRQIEEIHTAELLVPNPSTFEIEILVELIQAGGETLWSEIHKLINSVWNKEELPDQWKESITISVHKKGNKN
jgi:hypothetical protein